MDNYELDHSVFQSNKGDESLYVLFYMSFLQNQVKSEAEGRPIYDDCEFVKIFSPGDRNNVVDRPVRPSDRLRFPKQWAMFQTDKNSAQISGTPLAQWPIVSRAMAEELKYLGFTTVEQIAEARDDVVGKMMGMRDLKNKAIAYIEIAKGSTKPIEEMQSKINELDTQIRMRDEALAVLKTRIDELTAPKSHK